VAMQGARERTKRRSARAKRSFCEENCR
jgi:hypothetical protein